MAGACSTAVMPRFFFHMVNDTYSVLDEEGQDVADSEAACVVARRTIGEMIAQEVTAGSNLVHLAIMIDDQAGVRIANVKAVANIVIAEGPLSP